MEANPKISKDINFLYFYKTLRDVWENADFAIGLGTTEYHEFSFYPTRMVMENTFRLEFFTRQKTDKQIEIATKEMLRIAKRFYDLEKRTGGDGREFQTSYEAFAQKITVPKIDVVRERDLDPFPSMWDLMSQSKIEGGSSWYFDYQSLAELTHGKVMSIVMKDNDELAEHRRSLMYLQTMSHDLIKNADFHLGHKMRKEVVDAIQTAEAIVKAPL
jgi:hypothetical protein